ncbi:MAG: ATP-binding cassette domain-containing protein [Deltaproteobacteria bacterium]|nr:ATP-binding cassette domain-containing protein [Deltaproteobacteria bacterium]
MYAIEANSLTKHYRVYLQPIDRLKEMVTRRSCHELVEALKGVSFQIPYGETLGIIGENGSGKSTLLKILAGTTQPTGGNLVKKGRTAALLELGSGFHPDFSGRKNIHLNAALLGLDEKEISEKEPEIISFSELEEVIDRPVKTYSSGMYMRLAFSIAISVDPDILIIDEALSVGDQYFQKKCIERMTSIRDSGKTFLFCSHNMYLIAELCQKSIWLHHGRMRDYGESADVVGAYMAYLEEKESIEEKNALKTSPSLLAAPEVTIDEVFITDIEGARMERVVQFQTLVVKVKIHCIIPFFKGHVGIALMKPDDKVIFAVSTKRVGFDAVEFSGDQLIELLLPSLPLGSGAYKISAMVSDEYALSCLHENRSEIFNIASEHPDLGMFWLEHKWKLPE